MRSLLNTLRRLPEFEDLLLRIDAGRCPVAASGLSPVHRAFVAAGIALRAERPVVLLLSLIHISSLTCLSAETGGLAARLNTYLYYTG